MSALGEKVSDLLNPNRLKGDPVPTRVRERLDRGRKEMQKDAPQRRLSLKFWRGESYWYLNEKGQLRFQDTTTFVGGGGKPRHRIRNKYNFVHPLVESKVSSATQKVPGYEIIPSTTDPEDIGAARLAEQVAWYGYNKWRMRRVTTEAVTYALVTGEGFVMPYFDPNVGPYRQMADPVTGEVELVGEGEVKLLVLSGNEVYWEPGCSFDDSRWIAIERARPIDEVQEIPGFVGGNLIPDASTSDIPTDREQTEMVLVTEYFERPTPTRPDGLKLTIANKRVIAPPEQYPCLDGEGNVCDEPVLHRISYVVDPEADRDRGLVEQLIDLQRTVNDCWNKMLEWKNRSLNPQLLAPTGSLVKRRDDEPGAVIYYDPVAGQVPQWETAPRIPPELVQMREDAIAHMRVIAADVDVQAAPDVAARTTQAAIEQAQNRWQSFLGDLAEFHGNLMRHCLYLVQRHYSEPRLLKLRGRYGWEPIENFTGSDLRGQADVRVLPGSIVSKTRDQIQQELEMLLASYPGQIPLEATMAALNGGNAEKLIESYELQTRRANWIVDQLRQGPDAMLQFQPRFDSDLGMLVPGWMPRKQDSIVIHRKVVGDYMLTEDFDMQPPEVQAMFNEYFAGLDWQEQQKAIHEAMQQEQTAQALGMQNAAAPQAPTPMPDQRGLPSAQNPRNPSGQ